MNAGYMGLGFATLIALVTSGTAATADSAAVDSTCRVAMASRNQHSYPPDVRWVWSIPQGCVFVRDRPATAACPSPDCTSAPDVYVRYRSRAYVFHLTLPAATEGLYRAQRRLVVGTDGRAAKSRRLVIDVIATEFRSSPDLGPPRGQHLWQIRATLDRTRGLCCPPNAAGNPGSRWDVAPLF